MEETTRTLLRQAALTALNDANDRSAYELLALLNQEQVQITTGTAVKALPASCSVIDAPAHDYHYWARFIRENFLPFMSSHGRMRFTSPELFSWLENSDLLCLTSGDLEEHSSGREVWRGGVTTALGDLKKQGVLTAPPFARVYEIVPQSLPFREQQKLLDV